MHLSFLKYFRLLPVHHWICSACLVSRLVLHRNSYPNTHSVSGWREGFQECSCLTPLPLRQLASKYSQAHCKYTYFLPTWPCGYTEFLPICGPRRSSSVKASVTFFCLCEAHWQSCTREERTYMGITRGWIMHGLWRNWKFRTLGFEGICAMSGRRNCEPLLWRPVLDVQHTHHVGFLILPIIAYLYLQIFRYICIIYKFNVRSLLLSTLVHSAFCLTIPVAHSACSLIWTTFHLWAHFILLKSSLL